jgi:hypothetical protein
MNDLMCPKGLVWTHLLLGSLEIVSVFRDVI